MSLGSTLTSTRSVSVSGTIEHDRVAGGDHAADGIRGRLEDDAVLRRADIGALELILRRHLALDIFADLAVGLAQLLGDVAGQFLIDLDDLQLDLGDLALGFGGGGDELAAFALRAGPPRARAR